MRQATAPRGHAASPLCPPYGAAIQRGTAERWIKEGKATIKATPEPIKGRSLASLKEKPIKIGARVARHGPGVADACQWRHNQPDNSVGRWATGVQMQKWEGDR